MRIMFDSVDASRIPADAQIVGGYINGRYAWKPSDWARFPTARKVTIAVSADADAKCLDVETYDATSAQAPGWAHRQRARGEPHPWVYIQESTWAECRHQFAIQQEPEPIWWIAGYPGSVGWNLYPGSHAHQVIDDGPYDRSLVADHVPGLDPSPAATVATTTGEPDMAVAIYFTFGPDQQHLGLFRSDRTWITHLGPASEVGGKDIVDKACAPTVTVVDWPNPDGRGVNEWRSFGRPIDKETAVALGAAWPA